jgi:predicted ATPase/DNA-binding XRE family transcriptional regulator
VDEGSDGRLARGTSFGSWLRRRRKGLDLTREALGRQVGYSAATIRKIEAEERRPSLQLAAALAELFAIPPGDRAAFVRFARGELLAEPPGERADRSAASPPPRRLMSLPAATTSFIGRDDDMAAVRRYLDTPDTRLLTLVGPPGIGKTRLSLETARAAAPQYADGVFFAPLAPLSEPEQVARAVIRALGLVEREGYPAAERLQAGIGARDLLLILDNAEHLVEAVADLVAALLPACPSLKILCTSRESLRVPGEWLYPLTPLAVPEEFPDGGADTFEAFSALWLFADRARAVQPDFTLTAENVEAVAEICRELDGLPLAIELMAARMRLLSPAELLARLDSGFALSADGRRGVPARQKSLHEAIAWSYDLMSGAERKLFAGLAVFAGGFTVEAVEGLFGPQIAGEVTGELLSSLLDKSLVQRILGREGEQRLLMLATIRHFAAERLREMGEEPAQRDQHLAYFLELAKRAEPELRGPEQIEWINRVEGEFDNFRAALNWALAREESEKAMRLLVAIAWALFLRGHADEARDWFERVTALPGAEAYPLIHARLLIQIGRQHWLAYAYAEANAALAKAEALAGGLGSAGNRELGYVHFVRGLVLGSQGKSLDAIAEFEEALRFFEMGGRARGVAHALHALGWTAVFGPDAGRAGPLLERSLALFQELGDLFGVARVSQGLGDLYLRRGDLEQAQRYYERTLAIDEALSFREGTSVALWSLGRLHRRRGDYPRARHYHEACRELSRNYDLFWYRATAAYGLGMVALHEQDFNTAAAHFRRYYHEAPGEVADVALVDVLFGLAAVAAATNERERAARLFGAGQALLAAGDYRPDPFDWAEFERHLAHARAQLGEEAFAALAGEGARMGVEEAVAYALAGSGEQEPGTGAGA